MKTNNQIEDLCNDVTLDPLTYSEIEYLMPGELANEMKLFFNNLYDKILNRPSYKLLTKSQLKDHFNSLMTKSDITVCPFCGLNPMMSKFDKGRNAYDHYFPKGIFPFSSVNFKNLVPICSECNSSYKLEKVIIFEDTKTKSSKRQRAFYPFSTAIAQIDIEFKTRQKVSNLSTITPAQLDITLKCNKPEELKTWLNVFEIERRYKARVCTNINTWLEQMLDEYRKLKIYGVQLTWAAFLDAKLETISEEKYRLQDQNFLKHALFDCLNKKGELRNLAP